MSFYQASYQEKNISMPKVSVVITAYNAMAYLPQTMESVLWQSFTDFEVVLVNNGSTDNIVEWVA
jgi:glycosyltransferase involved in cell wall biosynthesis